MNVLNEERIYPQEVKKVNIIQKLKEYKDQDKIAKLLKEYEKKQESDYFLTQSNINIGKINPYNQKKSGRISLSHFGPSYILIHSSKKKLPLSQNSMMKFKSSNSLSSSKIERIKSKDILNINKNHYIDNKSLKNYFNEVRQRIKEEKSKKEENKKLLTQFPYPIRKSLLDQEKFFRKIMKEKMFKKKMQEKIKKKCNKQAITDLLINKSNDFDKKSLEISIIDKNMTNSYRYRGNLWNITLRNTPVNGKYENIGYINVGNKYQPLYTIFDINKNIEYFNNPRYERYKTEDCKKRNNKLISNLDENNYNLKMKQNLLVLDTIKNLEIKGKNLLEVEDKRESDIKGKKIIYNKQDLDYLIFKHKERNKIEKDINNEKEVNSTLEEIYEEKIFARNYKKNDFFKNSNLTSRYSYNFKI